MAGVRGCHHCFAIGNKYCERKKERQKAPDDERCAE